MVNTNRKIEDKKIGTETTNKQHDVRNLDLRVVIKFLKQKYGPPQNININNGSLSQSSKGSHTNCQTQGRAALNHKTYPLICFHQA